MVEGEGRIDNKVKIEKLSRLLQDRESSSLYSPYENRVVELSVWVAEKEREYYDLLYDLAGNKGETIESLKRKTLGEIIEFSERLARDARRH